MKKRRIGICENSYRTIFVAKAQTCDQLILILIVISICDRIIEEWKIVIYFETDAPSVSYLYVSQMYTSTTVNLTVANR